ncbi:MAG: hypothetical protein KGI29_10450 [Pseudomonadota bacterium]|nr:hypothetical protein [Pseudomonadota bacterium]MDE3038891.1 hypothetical protein [Pseudomonadota bacterium]
MITDLTPYREYVDVFDITEKQKLELVNALWMLAESILDHQFGLNDTRAELEPKPADKSPSSNPSDQKGNCSNNKK